MFRRFFSLVAATALLSLFSCNDDRITIHTDLGDMKLVLFDETPKHKENFIKLVKEGFYDSLLFHRVIKDFMIQGGDPDSKNASPDQPLGMGNIGYTIPEEINPKYFHKRGALAAARTNNPEKASSGSQFYIVQGKVWTNEELTQMEEQKNNMRKDDIMRQIVMADTALSNRLRKLQIANDQQGFMDLIGELTPQAEAIFKEQTPFKFTEEQIKVYTTIGGYPALDGEYTVFGEIVDGLDVIDKIASVKTKNDRPEESIRMEIH